MVNSCIINFTQFLCILSSLPLVGQTDLEPVGEKLQFCGQFLRVIERLETPQAAQTYVTVLNKAEIINKNHNLMSQF